MVIMILLLDLIMLSMEIQQEFRQQLIGKAEVLSYIVSLHSLTKKYVDRIEAATKGTELLDIWNEMKENAFISYKVNPKDIDDTITDFEALSLDEQKHLLMELLDKKPTLCELL